MNIKVWILAIFGGVLGFALPRLFHLPIETTLAAFAALAIAMVIGLPLGFGVGHWISRDSDVDTTAYRIVAWANLACWLIPVVGMTISAVTHQLFRHSDSSKRQFFWLAVIGGLLASANAAVGGALEATHQGRLTAESGL